MKKSLILAGMLSIGYAYAQEGRVGINTETPSATLEITPSTNNAKADAKTNEGIIAPKLSKVRIANIETPVEGTLVYATDATYTGSNDKVAKITEKGYYFYNGTEWVKVQYQDTNDAEWVYDASTKRINLKRSGQATGFVNKVYYDEKGGLTNIDAEKYNVYNLSSSQNVEVSVNDLGYYDKTLKLSKNIERVSNSAGTAHFKILEGKLMVVNGDEPTSNTRFHGKVFNLVTTPEDTKSHDQLYANQSGVQLSGRGSVNHAIGNSSSSQVINSEIKGYVASMVSDAHIYTPKSIKTSYGINTRSFLYGSGKIDELIGINTGLQSKGGSSSNITKAIGHDVYTLFEESSGTNIDTLYGIRYGGINSLGVNGVVSNTSTVKKAYGLFVGDVMGASEANYSIYTHNGNVRIGDLVGAGDRAVYVDANGVLKTGVATTTPAVEVGSTKSMKCDSTNRGKMNFVKNDTGSDIFGICLRNKDGNYYWGLLIGGGNLTTGGETFFGE